MCTRARTQISTELMYGANEETQKPENECQLGV